MDYLFFFLFVEILNILTQFFSEKQFFSSRLRTTFKG